MSEADDLRKRAQEEIDELVARVEKNGLDNERVNIKMNLELRGADAMRYLLLKAITPKLDVPQLTQLLLKNGTHVSLLRAIQIAHLNNLDEFLGGFE